MPCHDYHCHACGHDDFEYHKMGHSPSVDTCPKCGAFEYIKEVSLPHTSMREFSDGPILMYSVAVNELAEIRRLKVACPDADICDDPASELYGVPVARSRHAKLQILKATGFRETERNVRGLS